jgi:S1-C subfamily serine protease
MPCKGAACAFMLCLLFSFSGAIMEKKPIERRKNMKKSSVRLLAILCVMVFFLQGCSYADLSALLGSGSLTQNALSAEDIYYRYAGSVVEVTAETAGATMTGTGFFCDEKGTIITNYHVIETCASAYITLPNGKTYDVIEVMGHSVERMWQYCLQSVQNLPRFLSARPVS